MRLHIHHHADPELAEALRALTATLNHFPKELRTAMTAATDHLNAALDKVGASVTTAAQKIADELAIISAWQRLRLPD